MGHPVIENRSGFALEILYLLDEDGVVVLVPIVQATFVINRDRLTLAEQQRPVNVAGEPVSGEPDASYRYEPQIAFTKLNTDVVLVGHAWAGDAPKHQIDVGLKVGPVQKIVRVFGDRYWVKTGGGISATRPQPFEKIPLIYERAFGGWDRAHRDESKWTFDPRNPVGRGFGDPLRYVEEGKVPMPNLEDPSSLIGRYGDSPRPAGFGFISTNWQPRVGLAGTYDEAWDRDRKPMLPKDFDRRFFNAGSPGLIAPGYLKGDEDVVVVNGAPISPLRFRLPAVPPPVCAVRLRPERTELLGTNLDTIIIDTDQMLVLLLWRAYVPVPNGPSDVLSIEVSLEPESARATA